ncbi:hypothetical protein N9335_00280 [Crocinitomicaceae bacterium]|nr:hypothetical protein [Crocinitomicaceae bacterium]
MKKLLQSFTTLSLILLVSNSCKKIDKFTQFNMDFNNEITIPSSTGINLPINLLTPEVETNSESTFEVNDTRKDLIEEIRLNSLILTLDSPNNADFSFLESISVYMNAQDLPEVEIAWKDNVPEDAGSQISLNVSNQDFKEYIKKDEFILRVNTITDEILTSDHKINIASDFFIDAKILGL